MQDLLKQLDYLADQVGKVETMMVDPVEFGELKGQVQALQAQVSGIASKVDTLLEMANQGKGGLWMFNAALMAAGGVLAWLADHFLKGIK